MNETDKYHKVLKDAEAFAACLGHGYIGTEHLLLAILRNVEAGEMDGIILNRIVSDSTPLQNMYNTSLETVKDYLG